MRRGASDSLTFISRRAILAASAGMMAFSPALARKKKKKAAPAEDPSPFSDMGNRIFAHLRESGTYGGVPLSLNGGPLARTMDDYSPAGEAALRAEYQAGRDLLARIRIAGTGRTPTYLGVISATLANATQSAAIPYGRINPFGISAHAPYVVNQISGPHIDGLATMMEQQSLGTANAVDAWLEKLDGFPAAFAGVIGKLRADQAAGCMPPAVLLAKTLPVLESYLTGKPADQPLLMALARRTDEAGLSRRIRSTAQRRALMSFQRRARPALAALRNHIRTMLPLGRSEAGLWAQPSGTELYAANVHTLGDTDKSPDEIHRIGLDEVTRIAAQMNGLLAKQGMSDGSIGERLMALSRDPKNQFADSDAGRAALLDHVRAKVAEAEKRYAEILPEAMIPRQALIVKR